MKITKSEQVELCTKLASQMIDADGWGEIITYCEDGSESYDDDTQDRFNNYYGLIWGCIENAKS